jgi:hypothetical protein
VPEPTGEAWTDNYVRVDVPVETVPAGLQVARVWSRKYARSEAVAG